MSFLENLDEDNYNLLVRLPYRVGYWISQSDQTGGAEADALEEQALRNIIEGFTRDVFGSETVQYVMMETYDHQRRWHEWQDDLHLVLEEVRDALKLLDKIVDPKELSSFKLRLMEIAEAVALAFREMEPDPSKEGLEFYIIHFTDILKELFGIKEKNGEAPLNISPSERKALEALQKVMDSHQPS